MWIHLQQKEHGVRMSTLPQLQQEWVKCLPPAKTLYQGRLVFASPNPISAQLGARLKALIAPCFQCEPEALPQVHQQHDDVACFEHLQRARKVISSHQDALSFLLGKLIQQMGWSLDHLVHDEIRLRSVTPRTHTIAAAQAALTTHRDTWYANPRCQINLWMPLFELPSTQSFGFYPDAFECPVANTSALFDFERFQKHVGFQGDAGHHMAVFPEPVDELQASLAARFSMPAAGTLWFSAAHLHRTLPNLSNETRWSMDCRIVNRRDQRMAKGARDVDNASTGDASSMYRAFSQ